MKDSEIQKYEDLIYKMIIYFKEWGLWYEPAAFYFNGKKYAACQKDECVNSFRNLKFANVSVGEGTTDNNYYAANYYKSNREYDELVPYEIRLEFNSGMVDLYEFGMYGVELRDLSLDKQLMVVKCHPELMEGFEDDADYMAANPDEYPDFPKSWEFDSADEFMGFRDIYIDELRREYIKELDKSVTMDNDAEAEICEIIIDAGMHYFEAGTVMYIGKDV